MKKFKNFLVNHKEELQILGVGSILVVGAYYLGRDINIMRTDDELIKLGNNGESLFKRVGSNMYELKVIKTEITE